MPYQKLLDGLVRDIPGALSAQLLDSEGEVAIHSGVADERHRLIGAYQGIHLSLTRQAMERHGMGPIRYLVCRYDGAQVILRPLKDGYYLVVSLAPDAGLALGVERSAGVQRRMNQEL